MRRLCNMKLKVIKRKILRILVLISTALFYNEWLVYYLVLWSCHYPNQNQNSDDSTRVMVLADTHLLGSRLGHWADKLRREWQMHRTFQTAQTLFRPEHVFFLGDLFDEGKWCSPKEFDYYVSRFNSLFIVDKSQTRVHVMAGNHDIGFHYAVTPYLDQRFNDAFQTESVQLKIVDQVPFVIINSVAFEGDSCFLCSEAMEYLKKVKSRLKKLTSKPILLSHYPLYRKSDSHCDEADEAPADEKMTQFREGWDCLTRNASQLLLETIKPRLVLSGHTHHGCNTTHGDLTEISVSSFSWRNKKNPAFLLGNISPNSHSLSKCFMPNENTVFTTYVFFISLIIFSSVIK